MKRRCHLQVVKKLVNFCKKIKQNTFCNERESAWHTKHKKIKGRCHPNLLGLGFFFSWIWSRFSVVEFIVLCFVFTCTSMQVTTMTRKLLALPHRWVGTSSHNTTSKSWLDSWPTSVIKPSSQHIAKVTIHRYLPPLSRRKV